MLRLRRQLYTMNEIGKRFGISRQRVYQILNTEPVEEKKEYFGAHNVEVISQCIYPDIKIELLRRRMNVSILAKRIEANRTAVYNALTREARTKAEKKTIQDIYKFLKENSSETDN